jgi:Permeases of the drug/metabolite transporter (DMT) superfamily
MLKKYKYPIRLLLGVLMFSTFEVTSKAMHGHITATQLTFYRFLIGGVILLPFGIRDLKKHQIKFTPKLLLTFIVMGFLLVTISMNVCQIGLQMSSANIVAVLFSSNPLFISLFSALILREKLSPNKIAGLLIGIAGVVVTCGNIIKDPSSVDAGFMMGVLLVLIAMLVFSFYTVFNKKLSLKMGSCGCLSLSTTLGALTLLPVMINQGVRAGFNPFVFEFTKIWPQFLYISIFVTGLAYYFYYDSMANMDTSISSMSFFVKPPLASILAAFFLNEKITANIILGIILIFLGVIVSTRRGVFLSKGKTKDAGKTGSVRE